MDKELPVNKLSIVKKQQEQESANLKIPKKKLNKQHNKSKVLIKPSRKLGGLIFVNKVQL